MSTIITNRRHHVPDAGDLSTGTVDQTPTRARRSGPRRSVGLIGTLVLAAGVILGVSGAATWTLVQGSLADERITVAADAERFAGDKVDGPFTAYSEAQIIEKHTLTASKGKTYAELDREDPVRATVMNGSFLRASLFTSVLSFGVAALAMGLGVLFIALGWALRVVAKTLPDHAS